MNILSDFKARFAVLLVAAFVFTAEGWAMPASTVKVTDSSNLVHPGGENLFIGTNFNTGVGLKGLKGFGVTAGYHFEKSFFLDLAFNFYQFPYEAVKVYFQGMDQTTFVEGSELARDRSKTSATMFTVGPGIGVFYKLFDSKRWVESARFGLNYLSYHEGDVTFMGGVVNFQGTIGYHLDPVLISLGLGWNLGYMQRVTDAQDITTNNYLPIQWWSFQLSALMWIY